MHLTLDPHILGAFNIYNEASNTAISVVTDGFSRGQEKHQFSLRAGQ